MKYTYTIVDIETSGPVPGKYSMLSIGACVAFNKSKRFYVEIKPINENYQKGAMAANKLSMRKLRKYGKDPEKAMELFDKWVRRISGKDKPVFVARPATFDWPFVNYYFEMFLGRNPFMYRRYKARVIDMKSYFMGKMNLDIDESSRDKLFEMFPAKVEHTHNALDDAVGYAETFEKLLKHRK